MDSVRQPEGVTGGPTVLVDGDEVTIVDTGVPDSAEAILALVAEAGRTPGDVRRILLTHADGDHMGSLAALVALTGAPVYASAPEAEIVEGKRPGRSGTITDAPVQVDHVVAGGDVLPFHGGVRVVDTNGHTSGHVSFFVERDRLLLAGDALRNMDGLQGPSPEFTDDMDRGWDSVAVLAELDPDAICFGHGPPIASGAAEQLRALRR